jgi:hypothetical protein
MKKEAKIFVNCSLLRNEWYYMDSRDERKVFPVIAIYFNFSFRNLPV